MNVAAGTAMPPGRIVAVHGFVTPKFCFWPWMSCLRREGFEVDYFSYPLIGCPPDRSVDRLANHLRGLGEQGVRVGCLTHSFGDFVTWSAIARLEQSPVTRVASMCPVATTVPFASVARRIGLKIVPELRVMGDADLVSPCHHSDPSIEHLAIWTKGDYIVRRPTTWPRSSTVHRVIAGTHASVLVQRSAQHLALEFLRRGEQPQGRSPRPSARTNR